MLAAVGLAVSMIACGTPVDPAEPRSGDLVPQVETQASTPPAAADPPTLIESRNNLVRVRHMVLSVTLFTLLHELGHMIVSEYDPPVIGTKESGADRFAALAMTPPPRPPGLPREMFDPAIEKDVPGVIWAAWWWHSMHDLRESTGVPPDYADSHGLDEQRSRQVMCLIYGAEPARFEAAFARFLPAERRQECLSEAADNRAAWRKVLERRLGDGSWWKYEGRVTYHDAPAPLAAARTLLMDERVLELFAENVNALPVPPRAVPPGNFSVLDRRHSFRLPIDVVGDACLTADGHAIQNALWDPDARRITLSYGLVSLFEELARSAIARTDIGQRETLEPAPARQD
jgi:hypothetical protein